MTSAPSHRCPWAFTAALALSLCLAFAAPAAAQDDDPEAMFSQGVELFNAGEYRDAAEKFRQVFEVDPNPFMLFNIARCYHELGDLETAAKYYDRSLALDGLPRDAKVEAIKRLDDIQVSLEQRRGTREATRRASLALRSAREALAASAAVKTTVTEPVRTDGPADGSSKTAKPATTDKGRGTLTWVGATLGVVGLAAVGGGTWFALQVGDDLDRHKGLVDDYTALQAQALASGDTALAAKALTMADNANVLATQIEQDQRLSLALFAGGGALVIGGIVMILVDAPEDTDVSVIATPTGVAIVGLW